MKTRISNFIIAFIILLGNIAFYTIPSFEYSGSMAAAEVHPLFLILVQSLFLSAIVSYIYFGIKNL